MKTFLKQLGILPDKEIDTLVQLSGSRTLQRGDYFIRQGETCKEVAFIVSGILRSFYVSEQGEEMTYCISFPNQFMTAYSSFISGKPSLENLQVIEKAELLIIPKHHFDALAVGNIHFMRFLKSMAEQEYMNLEKRIFEFQKEKAAQRYLNLIKDHPDYVKFIPLSYLASYLNISQRHLSRIRKELVF